MADAGLEERALASAARVAAGMHAAKTRAEKVVLKVRPATRGRATGWSLDCPHHGPMPVLAPSRAAAIEAAREHLELDHGKRGTIDVVVPGAGSKKPKRKKRR